MKINNRFLLSRIKNFYTRNEQKIEIVLNIKKYLYCNNVNKITSVSNHSCPQANKPKLALNFRDKGCTSNRE